MSNTFPFITILCPVLNAGRTLNTMFEYVFKLDWDFERMEIILADGGSTDTTMEVIKSWAGKYPKQVRWVEVPKSLSPGFARNEALKMAKGEYVLFTDGDCAPQSDWAKKLLQPFSLDKKIGGVGGEITTLRTDPNNDTETYCEQTRFLSVSGRCGITASGYMPEIKNYDPHEVNGNDCPFFATANLAVPKKVLDEIGNEFWHEITGEDVDFCLRIQRKGYRLYFAKDAIIQHMHRISEKAFYEQLFGYGFGHPLLIQKHARKRLEIILQYGKRRNIPLGFPFYQSAILHIGDYQLFKFFGWLFLAGMVAGLFIRFEGWMPMNLIFLGLFFMFLFRYFRPALKLKPRSKFFVWCRIRYCSNKNYINGAKKGMREFGNICHEASW